MKKTRKTTRKPKANGLAVVMRRLRAGEKPSIKRLLLMQYEWEASMRETGSYDRWWKKYPCWSHTEVLEEIERKLKLPKVAWRNGA